MKMRVARMKWGENAAVIKIDVKKFFYNEGYDGEISVSGFGGAFE